MMGMAKRLKAPKTAVWKNPVKGVPAKESTMNTEGDFGDFTELMRSVVLVQPQRSNEKRTIHASLVPAVS